MCNNNPMMLVKWKKPCKLRESQEVPGDIYFLWGKKKLPNTGHLTFSEWIYFNINVVRKNDFFNGAFPIWLLCALIYE